MNAVKVLHPWPAPIRFRLLLKHDVLQYYKVSPNELKVGSLPDAALLRIAARDC